MKFIQKYFILIYIISLCLGLYILFSCSAESHLAKAIKKDPNIIKPKIDTVTIKVPEFIESKKGKDSLIIDNNRIWIKALSIEDSLFVDYKIKSILIDTVIETKIINDSTVKSLIDNKNSRQKNRFDYKTKKLEIKKEARIKIVKEKQKNKPKQKNSLLRRFYNSIKSYFFFLLFFVIGFVLGRLTKFYSIKL